MAPPKSVLPATWDLPAEFRQRVGEKAGRQRVMAADGHLLLILHLPPKHNESDRAGRFIWPTPAGPRPARAARSGPTALAGPRTPFA
mgnify:CR=1 FL=1